MIPYPKRERTFPPRPGTQSLRQGRGRQTILGSAYMPRRGEPHRQQGSGLFEDGPCRRRRLGLANPAGEPSARLSPRFTLHATRRAHEAVRPPQVLQVCHAGCLVRKARHELHPGPGVIVTSHRADHLVTWALIQRHVYILRLQELTDYPLSRKLDDGAT
jgi:hypothetical protein